MFTLVLRCLAVISVLTSLMVGYDFIVDPVDIDRGKITKLKVIEYDGKTSFNVTVLGRRRYLKEFDEHQFDILEVGDDVELKLGRFIGEWVHVNISRNGKPILSIQNFEQYGCLAMFIMFFAPISAFLPKRHLYKRKELPGLILVAGGLSIVLILTHVLR